MTEELVLVVPRDALVGPSGWYGLNRAADLPHALAVIAEHGQFLPRASMERDPRWKQVIPYLVLRDGARWFLMRRTRAGGDDRLHDRWSIGVGGHVNPGDAGVVGGLRREWQEELVAAFEPPFEPVGLLNDDTTPVGAVHLGVVFTADAAGRRVDIRETQKLTGAFADGEDVLGVREDLETWSRIVFDELSPVPIG